VYFLLHLCVQNTKHKQTSEVQELHTQGSKVLDIKSPESTVSGSDELQWLGKQPTTKKHKQDTTDRLSGDSSKYKLDRFFAGGKGKKKYPAGHCKVHAAQKQSETRYIHKFCFVALHRGCCFETYLSIRN
jgi:hypothetical protein